VDLLHPLTGLLAILIAAVFFCAAWGAGSLVIRRTPGAPTDVSLVQVAVGSGLLGYAAFVLGLIGWFRPAALITILLLGVAALMWSLRRGGVLGGLGLHPDEPGTRERWLAPAVALTAAAALGWGLLGALLPEVEYDALWYHLTFPRRYLASGFLEDMACDHMSPSPQHVELMYGYGLVAGDARTAKLIHMGFGVLAAAWTGRLAAQDAGRTWGLVAVAFFLTAPTVLWEMTTAYNELPLALFGTGAVALLLEWRRSGSRHFLVLAGVLLGFGLAGKHLATFFLAPLALGVLLVSTPARPRAAARRIGNASLLVAVAVAVALPWYIRAWVLTGNPLFPMFYDALTALGIEVRRWDAVQQSGWAAAMDRYGHGRGAAALLLLPFRATWNSVQYAGSMGPAWLLGLPLLVLVWKRLAADAKLMAGLVLVFLVLWATPWSSFQIRYLVPIAPLVSVLLAAAVREFSGILVEVGWVTARKLVVVGMVAVLVLNLPAFVRLHDARRGWIPNTIHVPWPVGPRTVLGLHDPELYLRSYLKSYRVVPRVNALVPADGRIVWSAEAAHFYIRAETIMDYSICVREATWGSGPGDEEAAYRHLRAAGVTHVVWDRTHYDEEDEGLAIRSSRFLGCYAERLYEVDSMVLIALLSEPRYGAEGCPEHHSVDGASPANNW
jgi:hypothetical protein